MQPSNNVTHVLCSIYSALIFYRSKHTYQEKVLYSCNCVLYNVLVSVPEAEASPSETPGKVANRNSDPMKSGTKNGSLLYILHDILQHLGLKFWEYIRAQLTPDELHPSDKQVLQGSKLRSKPNSHVRSLHTEVAS